MFSEAVKDVIMIGAGGALIHQAWFQAKRGVAQTIFAVYPRATRPTGFWAWVSASALIGSSCALIGIASLLGA